MSFAPFESSKNLTSPFAVAKLERSSTSLDERSNRDRFAQSGEAEQVRRELVTIQQQHLIALEDACVLEH